MRLRKLERRDAPFMLEWMHDRDVVKDMMADFASKTIEDCQNFIEMAQEEKEHLHLAVVDDSDEYMGTVSLKNICLVDGYAEFAITVRKCAMGLGFSKYAMEEIIRIGFEQIGLQSIYWDVSKKNARAIRFYEKMGAELADKVPEPLLEGYAAIQNQVQWYKVEKCEEEKC